MFILSWKIDKCLYTANGAKNPQYKNTFKLLKTHDALRVRQPNSSTARVDCVLETEGCCGQLKCLSLDFLCRYGAETSADVQCISNIEERAQRKSDQPVLQMYCNWNDQRSSCQGLGGGKLVRYGRSTKKKRVVTIAGGIKQEGWIHLDSVLSMWTLRGLNTCTGIFCFLIVLKAIVYLVFKVSQ